MISRDHLKARFEGCLLGQAVGDALGAAFEAQSAESIRDRFPTCIHLIQHPTEELWYTDDTEMAIGVCETLIQYGAIVQPELCRVFVENFNPSRGYGRGTRAILTAMEENRDYEAVAERQFPGGSFGNGAAMRVAPVGLLFRNDFADLAQQARLSALPTHRHPLGIEGAQLLAKAVSLASRMDTFDHATYFNELLAACTSAEYRQKIEAAAKVQTPTELAALGNQIEALHSVPASIASFALTPNSYEDTIANVIYLGGDTDTLAAMAGAISGAFLGREEVAPRLVALLEKTPKGGAYLQQLGTRLFEVYLRM